MNKILNILFILILIPGCSFNQNSKFWNQSKVLKEDKEIIYKEVFPKEEALKKEFNSNLRIKLSNLSVNKTFINNHFNNNKKLNFNGKLEKLLKYKFSKIENFDQYQPEISFFKNNVIFLITRDP